MKKLLIVLSLCVLVIGCDDMQKPVMDVIGDKVATPEETAVEVTPPEVDDTNEESVGVTDAVTIAEILADPEKYNGEIVEVEAHVLWTVDRLSVINNFFEPDSPTFSVFEEDTNYIRDLAMLEQYIFTIKVGVDGDKVGVDGDKITGILVDKPVQLYPFVEPPAEGETHEITFDNALGLAVGGRYHFRPTELHKSFIQSTDPDDTVLQAVYWGTIHDNGMSVERSDFPADAPKMLLYIDLFNPSFYFYTPDGDPVVGQTIIDDQLVYDEIVIKIIKRQVVGEGKRGERGNKFPYKYAQYEAVPIENLTHPDRIFEEYE